MKKVKNLTVSEYTVSFKNRPYTVQPQSFSIVEDEVAKEFMKYYPTVLKVEDVIEEPKVEKPKVAEKVSKTIKEKISAKAPKKAKVKKSKK